MKDYEAKEIKYGKVQFYTKNGSVLALGIREIKKQILEIKRLSLGLVSLKLSTIESLEVLEKGRDLYYSKKNQEARG